MGARINFWVIDDHIYDERNPEFEVAFAAKCTQWDKEHPNGYKDITDPLDLGNYIVGGNIELDIHEIAFVSLDHEIPNELIPEIRRLFNLDSIARIEYSWNGKKKYLCDFEEWFNEHLEWRPHIRIKTELPTVEQLGGKGKIKYIPEEEIEDGNMEYVRYVIYRQL